MPVTFLIGRAGTGKSERIFRRIVEEVRARPLGPPVFLLVPKQATFTTERELTCELGAFCRARVVSFDLLGRQIAADCGETAVPEVTDIGRQMILGHLLRRHQPRLGFFAGVARRPGLAAELDATFAEFERSGKTAADLADWIDQLHHAGAADAEGPSLEAKLRDLHLLYAAYTNYLGQERLDPHRRLQQVLERLHQCSLLRGAAVYVDGFTDFSEHERKVLAGLGRACASVEIALLIDPASPTVRDPHHLPDEMSLFHRTEDAYHRLWFAMAEADVKVTEPVVMRESRRFSAPKFKVIERDAFAASSPSPGTRGEGRGEGPVANGQATPGFRQNPHPNPLPEYRERAPETPAPAALKLIEAPDPRSEVEAVARGIRSLLRDGLRLRDIALLARDLGPYQVHIETTFREHGIPYFVDRRRTAAHHPLLQFVRSMFQIARGYWPHPAVMTFLKSGLAGVTLPEADEIENYLLQHNLRGRAWDDPKEWKFQRRVHADADEEALPAEPYETREVDSLRRQIVDRLGPFLEKVRGSAPVTVRQLAVEVFATLDRFNVRATVAQWVQSARDAGDLELAGEHGQVWAELVDLFEQMVDLLGDEQVTPADFTDVLEAGLERFDLALTPPTVDQVLVGQVDRTRTPPGLKAAFVLGLNDGHFPRRAQDETILSHAERRALQRRRVELDRDLHRRQLDEQLLGYVALTRASDTLVLSRPLVDEGGKATEPSPFWERLRGLFPEVQPEAVPRETQGDVRHLSTPRQLVTCLMRWAREGAQRQGDTETRRQGEGEAASVSLSPGFLVSLSSVDSSPDPRPALYQWLATHECCDDSTDLYRFRAWAALSYSNQAHLSRDVAARLFPAPLRASARQLETFASCPFRHFMRYGMRLADRSSHDVTAMDLSHVYHEVLEIVAGEVLENRREWQDLSPEQAREMVGTFAAAVAQRLRGEVLLSTARNKYLLQRVERTLEQVIASVKEMLARGTFRPAFAGLSFGDGARVPALKVRTPGGSEVYLSGQVDRVDLLEAGGAEEAAFTVFDYKLGANPLPMGHLYHGLSLQLLTYLLVLQANGEELAGKPLTPAAAFYAQLLRGYQRVEHPDEADDPKGEDFPLRWKPRGVFHGKYLADLDAQVAPGESSKVVQAYVKQDGQFGRRDATDVADAEEFAALLEHVRTRLGQLADGVMAGEVEATPYRIGTETPCPRCEFRPVCRFEPYVNRYRPLVPLRRGDALDRIAGRERNDGG